MALDATPNVNPLVRKLATFAELGPKDIRGRDKLAAPPRT